MGEPEAARLMFDIHMFAIEQARRLAEAGFSDDLDQVLIDAEAIAEFVKTGKAPADPDGDTRVVKAWGPFNPPWNQSPGWSAWSSR